jgi:hypothetical protein
MDTSGIEREILTIKISLPSRAGAQHQALTDLPTLSTAQARRKNKTRDKKGFAHIGNKDVPSSK